MAIFVTSDLHLNHKNISRFCGRPFTSTREMNKVLINNWNSAINPEDTVWYLGDLTLDRRKVLEYLDQLNGRITFVFGNHDKSRKIISDHPKVIKSGDILEEKLYNQIFTLSHYAMRVWNKSHWGSIHLYGHSHGNLPGAPTSMDVGVDNYFKLFGEYKPFPIEVILSLLKPNLLEKNNEE